MTSNEARGASEALGRNVMDTTGVGKRLPPAPKVILHTAQNEDYISPFDAVIIKAINRVTEKHIARGDNIMRLAKARYVAYVKYAEAADRLESLPPGASSLEVTELTDELVTSYHRLKEAAENLDWVSEGNASPDWTLSPEDELKWMDVK